MTEGSGALLARYTYDAAGQLARTDNGNGASTLYTYDSLGNVTQIETVAADGSLTSQLDYTYDVDSRPITATSLDGTWTYTYDAAGQLTHAVLTSTNASVASQDLTYTYDPAGNRTQTIFNGAVSNYTTNNLNQYTSTNGTTYGYDADGNLISKSAGGQTWNYSYNAENKLVSETGPAGTTTYSYDALGNMVSTALNNRVTASYVIDPLAIYTSATGPLAAVAQAYDGSGKVNATYDYGNGLTSETTASGTEYYNADATGNITSLTGAGGALSRQYQYSPFGILPDSIKSSDSNIFKYAGGLGNISLNNGQIVDRARIYDPMLGRFTTMDPTGLLGGID